MSEPPIAISTTDTAAEADDRFHRFRLISWWDQARLDAARVLVIGAGALGNEIVKNLALLGVGNLLIADMDRVENSNLSRSVLYREGDNGQFKATVAARAAAGIYPGIRAHAFNGNIVHDLGLGAFRWADVVICGLDNREARLAVNRACYRVNRPWIDGAIETIQGTARVFAPPGACYECTMSETDWKLLQMRRSCNLLSRSQMQFGKTPTTPTISSIIAGIQCQEAVKLLHGLESIAGRGVIFQGLTTDCYNVQYQRKADCMSHDPLDDVVPLDAGADAIPLAQLLARARAIAGDDATIELAREVLWKLRCPRCRHEREVFQSLGKVTAADARCSRCTDVTCDLETFFKLSGDEPFLHRTPAQVGLPAFDMIIARSRTRTVGLELTGDRSRVLGPLAEGEEALQWT